MINKVNVIFQAKKATIDIVTRNLDNLTANLQRLHNHFKSFFAECRLVANALEVASNFPEKRTRQPTTFFDDRSSKSSLTFTDKIEFQINVYNVALDTLNSQMKERCKEVAKVE